MLIDYREVAMPRIITQKDSVAKAPRVPYVIVPNFLSPEECNNFLDAALVDDSPFIFKQDHAYGEHADEAISARTLFLNLETTQGLHEKFRSLMLNVNDVNFRFKNLYADDSCFICEYREGDFRNWHTDGGYEDGTGYFNEIQRRRYMKRMLTCVVQLTDPEEYDGGRLELPYYHNPQEPAVMLQGSAILFPSYFWHRVSPVTAGTRYSLCGFLYSDFDGE